MNLKKEQVKEIIFLILSIICIVLTFVGAFMVITHKLDNAGYAVIPMVFALIFSMLSRNSKKAIEENKKLLGEISMKKENIYKFLYAVSIFLIIGFAIRLGVDYFKYDNINNSAPFYVFVIQRVIEFIIPSIIIFIVAKIVKKKYSK